MLFSGSTAFHLFGLATTSLSSWLPPNQEVIVDRNLEFVFRIRYRPFELELLLRVNKEAFNYYYLQVGRKILKKLNGLLKMNMRFRGRMYSHPIVGRFVKAGR